MSQTGQSTSVSSVAETWGEFRNDMNRSGILFNPDSQKAALMYENPDSPGSFLAQKVSGDTHRLPITDFRTIVTPNSSKLGKVSD